MKVTIDVPRTFEITLKQMDNFLISSGWDGKKEHNENTVSYQCIKYPNIFVILPKCDKSLVDSEHMMFTALRLIANVNNNCGIEAIINRVIGVEMNDFDKIKWCGCGDELTSKEDIQTGLCWICRAYEEDRRIEDDVRTNRYYDLIKGRMWMKGNGTGKYWSLLCNSRDAQKDARIILGLN